MSEPTRTVTDIAAGGAGESLELVVRGPRGTQRHPLPPSGVVSLGRGAGATICLDDARVSRAHLMLHLGAGVFVEDLGSHNGTCVGPQRLAPAERRPLYAGEVVTLGPFVLLVQRASEPPAPWDDARFDEALGRHAPFEWARFLVEAVTDRITCFATLGRAAGPSGGFRAGPGFFDALLEPGEVPRLNALAAELGRGATLRAWASVRAPEEGRTSASLGALLEARLAALNPSGASSREPAMVALHEMVERVAPGRLSVLILGETGVGKDVSARALHRLSGRRGAFISVNCAAISEGLLESELFGYERGAFTGAERAKPGLVEAAHQGTLFLDEVGELAISTQAKLLHVVEQQQVLRVGAVQARPVDVRFLAASNRDLAGDVKRRRFREDLYFRLAGLTLEVPPLRRRPGDILSLAELFAGGAQRLGASARAALLAHRWPGNVRELKNVIERGLLLSQGATLAAAHLQLERSLARLPLDPGEPEGLGSAEVEERRRILEALAQAAGNQTQAAKALGLSRSTLVDRLDKYRIPRPRR